MKILMVAAENGALAGGKVGGMGDVVRDVPKALAAIGHQIDVVMPGYQRFSKLPDAKEMAAFSVNFRGTPERLTLSDVPAGSTHEAVRCRVIEHVLLGVGGAGQIYCNDPPERPFASDASKFALFCIGVVQALVDGVLDDYDVIHLHDWHAALISVLIRFHPKYQRLASKRLVYTIHNLSLQGIRPLYGDTSSLQAWYPELVCDLEQVRDRRYPQCFNPMRAAIRLCDRVHAVSPTYAQEIQRSSDPAAGFVGGEGLELDLREAAEQHRLKGILNGCEYPATGANAKKSSRAVAKNQTVNLKPLIQSLVPQVERWAASSSVLASVHFLALRRLDQWLADKTFKPDLLVTSVGRLTEQKVFLLRQILADGRSALAHVLEKLTPTGVLIILGSGDAAYEHFFMQAAAEHSNLLFLNGYSDQLSQLLYEQGDVFLMPSSFEPCGISQMLAMRAGQPCLAHGVGGLLDTISDNETGFIFNGSGPQQQAENMLARLDGVVQLHADNRTGWDAMAAAAKAKRFLWSEVAAAYTSDLYQH